MSHITCQFTSDDFTNMLKDAGVQISMDGKGRVFHNIFSKRLWRTVKVEEFYYRLASCLRILAGGIRRIYTGDVGSYVMYIILFLAVLIFIQLKWKLW